MKRFAKYTIFLSTALALVYSGYWYIAASMIRNEIELALPQTTFISSVNLSEVTVSGFPSQFDVSVHNFSVKNEGSFSWSTPLAKFTAASLDPTRIDLDLSRPHAIGGRLGDMTLDTDSARVIALFGKTAQLPLQDLRFALESAKLSHASGRGLAAEKVISVIRNREGEDPGVYRIETEITGADISKILPDLPGKYQRLGPVVGVADVFFTSGWSVGDLTASLPTFRGAILQKLSASFGNSDLSLNGTLQVSPDASISGEVTLTITKWRELLQLARLIGKIDEDGQEIFAEMLAEVEALSGKPGTLELPLVIKNGAITYGIFTLGVIPPIR